MHGLDVRIQKLNIALPPLEIYRRLRPQFDASFMLESAVGQSKTVAYSFLGFSPSLVLRSEDGEVKGGMGHQADSPERYLSDLLRKSFVPCDRFPFAGGLVGYFSYEFARQAEPSLPSLPSEFPEFELGLYRECLIYDHSSFQVFHLSIGEGGELLEAVGSMDEAAGSEFRAEEPRPLSSKESFEEGVGAIKERIRDGETFQTVLSRRLQVPYRGDLLNLYSTLRSLNPSPYMFFLDFGERTVLGSSPETLLTVRGREATTFPIAGTRPLGGCVTERRRLREDLLSDEKERAEHAMLVDLARNDLSKVCVGGSVSVPDYMRVEEFSHVQHIVSKVNGTLQDDRTAAEALAAVFPAGTVSGAPKPRAMEIIQEVEGVSRGPYAGAVGYLSFNGNLDSAITIRSAFAADGRLYLQAGAGIVADSDPGREFEETEHKLASMRAALRLASEVPA